MKELLNRVKKAGKKQQSFTTIVKEVAFYTFFSPLKLKDNGGGATQNFFRSVQIRKKTQQQLEQIL